MDTSSIFLRRVVLKNYKSIAHCSVELRPVNFLIGQNGAGKSNFLDALQFTSDSLRFSVEHALRDRGGINEVRRRSTGHPTNFGVRLEWTLPSGYSGIYAFLVRAKQGVFEVQREACAINSAEQPTKIANYGVRSGHVERCSVSMPPTAAKDRLYLVSMSGHPEFRPLYDALMRMKFYNFNPDVIREHQSPDMGDILASDGLNLASVLKRMEKESCMADLIEKLEMVVPGIKGIKHKPVGKKETLEFSQLVGGSKSPWRFDAENMSDGTLRALGVLVALFQSPASEGQDVRIVGIEEPETALHPGAAAVLRSALIDASQRTQVIVTSHSPDLLDDKEIKPESLISVISQNGETKLGQIDRVCFRSIRDHLFTPGELLRLNQIGVDEEAINSAVYSQTELFANL